MKIEIRNLRFDYATGDFGISIPSLDIPAGQTLALVGPSGCGKTTFLNLLSGLVSPQEGEITVGSQPLGALSDAAKRKYRATSTGYVFQDFGLIDYLTAAENILYPYLVTGLPRPDDTGGRIRSLAARFGIEHVLNKKPDQISQGEKQRVAICRAVLSRPAILLADEPTGNLDPKNKAVILDYLFEQAHETGATLVVVTHDVDQADRFDATLDVSSYGRATA